jgi:branched-chain amino acid transport system permease protein
MFAQLIAGGLGTGCIYALVGLGFTLVYRTLRMVNFAQGQIFMAGTFLGLYATQRAGLPALPLLLFVAVVAFLAGMLLERVVFRRLYHSHEVFVVGAIGLGVMIENGLRIFFPEPLPFPKLFGVGVYRVHGAIFQKTYLWIVVITLILVVCLHVLFAYTRQGRALRAVAADSDIAGTMGVNVPRAIAVTFGLSCAVAAVAGVLIGPLYFVSPDMGDLVGLKAFSAAVLGGINSVIGTILGGLALGLLESLAAFYLSSDYKDLLAFAILLLMLLVRPQGLLGRPVPVKV